MKEYLLITGFQNTGILGEESIGLIFDCFNKREDRGFQISHEKNKSFGISKEDAIPVQLHYIRDFVYATDLIETGGVGELTVCQGTLYYPQIASDMYDQRKVLATNNPLYFNKNDIIELKGDIPKQQEEKPIPETADAHERFVTNEELRESPAVSEVQEGERGKFQKTFLGVLQDNWQTQIAAFYNIDKTGEEKKIRNAVIQEYSDLIAIYKSFQSKEGKLYTEQQMRDAIHFGCLLEASATSQTSDEYLLSLSK